MAESGLFEIGSMVVREEDKRIGVVVLDVLIPVLPKNGQVSVEWDGVSGSVTVDTKDLVRCGIVKARACPARCNKCLWFSGTTCYRYLLGRPGIFYRSDRASMVIPVRIYPYCQSVLAVF